MSPEKKGSDFNLSAKLSDSKILLNWNIIESANEYCIIIKTKSKDLSVKTTFTNTITINDLINGEIYSFQIKAFKTESETKELCDASETVFSSPLAIPENLTITEKNQKLSIKWSDIPYADGYRIYQYNSKNNKFLPTKYSTKNEKTIMSLENGLTYRFKIRAYKLINNIEFLSGFSNEICGTPFSDRLTISKELLLLNKGDGFKLCCEYKGESVDDVSWSCADSSVLSISQNGDVLAIKQGKTTITAKYNGNTVSTTVYVDREAPKALSQMHSKRFSEKNGSFSNDTAVVMITGDLMCTADQQRRGKTGQTFDFNSSMQFAKEIFKSADYVIGNIETMLSQSYPYAFEETRTDNKPNCNAPATFLDALRFAGFDALITSNNHGCDTGAKGITQTLSHINNYGFANVGLFESAEQKRYIIADVNNIRIAYLAYNMISNGREDFLSLAEREYVLSDYSKENLQRDIFNAQQDGAEFIVAFNHWGIMNSSMVRDNQRNTAQEMADCGVDYIIGSHPHVLQQFDILETEKGKKVPVIYSMGNFMSSMAEMNANRDTVILRIELKRNSGKVYLENSNYIPCYIVTKYKDSFYTTMPTQSKFNNGIENKFLLDAEKRISEVMGEKILPYTKVAKSSVRLHGSELLLNIFKNESFDIINKNSMFISQFTMCGEKNSYKEKNIAKRLLIDFNKSAEQELEENPTDYLVIDLYYAAVTSILKVNDSYFTVNGTVRKSDFYNQNINNGELIKPFFGEALWKPTLDRYIDMIKRHYSSERIILIRVKLSSYYSIKNQIRVWKDRVQVNNFLNNIENYFIEKVNPTVIDLSKYYFIDGYNVDSLSPINYEKEFYEDVRNTLKKIKSGDTKRQFSTQDTKLWLNRVIYYYENMRKRGFNNLLLNLKNPVHILIAETSASFVRENYNNIIQLIQMNCCNFNDMILFCNPRSLRLKNSIEIIKAITESDFKATIDFSLMFSEKFNILQRASSMLKILLIKNNLVDDIEINTETVRFYFEAYQDFLSGEPVITLKQQISDYYEITQPIEIDIWGSCVSREILNFNNKELCVKKYLFKNPFVSAFDEPIQYPEGAFDNVMDFKNNKWRRRVILESFDKKAIEIINSSKSKWLMADFYDLIAEMMEYKNGVFEVDEFVKETSFYKKIKKDCNSISLYEKSDYEVIKLKMDKFIEVIHTKYGSNIILVRVDLKGLFLNVDCKICALDSKADELERKRAFVQTWEQYLIDHIDCYVIDISKYFFADDYFPLGGAHIVHYEELFYLSACKIVTHIVKQMPTQRTFNEVEREHQLNRLTKILRNNPLLEINEISRTNNELSLSEKYPANIS